MSEIAEKPEYPSTPDDVQLTVQKAVFASWYMKTHPEIKARSKMLAAFHAAALEQPVGDFPRISSSQNHHEGTVASHEARPGITAEEEISD
jgi:hypothetical protein